MDVLQPGPSVKLDEQKDVVCSICGQGPLTCVRLENKMICKDTCFKDLPKTKLEQAEKKHVMMEFEYKMLVMELEAQFQMENELRSILQSHPDLHRFYHRLIKSKQQSLLQSKQLLSNSIKKHRRNTL